MIRRIFPLHCHFVVLRACSTYSTMPVKRVCVIGAGAAGLIAIRHIKDDPTLDGCVFEQSDSVGGIWNYTDSTGTNKYGLPVHSTAYKGLRTNLPKQIMEYLDYPFPDGNRSYICHSEVLEYLEKFNQEFELSKYIQFTTRVLNVEPINNVSISNGNSWKVRTENLKTQEITEHSFDSVLVCTGHHTKPYKPEIKDLELFQGEIWHSRDYRTPEPFAGKKVVVLGGGPSAIDISIELAECASQVILSCKSSNCFMPGNIIVQTPVVSAKSTSLLTFSGEEIKCDVLLLASGYVYDFPFLSPNCGITVEKGKYVYPLYRHLIHAKLPSMAFIGIPFIVCPFPLFDTQIRYFLKAFKGEFKLPSEEEMIREIKQEEESRREKCISLNHSHKLGDTQWDYNKQLANEAGFSELIKDIVQKIYDRAAERRSANPANYKFDHITIIDDESFIYIEDYYQSRS